MDSSEESRRKPTIEDQESRVRNQTLRAQSEVVSILDHLGNCLIDGFNSLGGKFDRSKENRLLYAWLLLLARSTQSWVCARRLALSGYYSQAITLIRTMTEDYLVACDCERNDATLDRVLGDCARRDDSRKLWNFKEMATRSGEQDFVYAIDYACQSSFAHPDRSLRALVSLQHGGLVTAPEYDDLLFLSCCELNLRATLLTLDVMRRLLARATPDGFEAWHRVTAEREQRALHWYDTTRTRFSENNSS